jgi:hypothetical protein
MARSFSPIRASPAATVRSGALAAGLGVLACLGGGTGAAGGEGGTGRAARWSLDVAGGEGGTDEAARWSLSVDGGGKTESPRSGAKKISIGTVTAAARAAPASRRPNRAVRMSRDSTRHTFGKPACNVRRRCKLLSPRRAQACFTIMRSNALRQEQKSPARRVLLPSRLTRKANG